MRLFVFLASLALALPAFAQTSGYVQGTGKPGAPKGGTLTVVTDPAAPLDVTGNITVNSAGAADTLGTHVPFSGNNVCATVATAGQTGAGFFLDVGTLGGTLSASTSSDATMAAPGCNATTGTWTPAKFVDASQNTSSSLVTTSPNASSQLWIQGMPGTRCVRVCTASSGTSGTATGWLTATTLAPPPPAAGADVTDRAGRLLGKVFGSDGSVLATANTGRLQVDAITLPAITLGAGSALAGAFEVQDGLGHVLPTGDSSLRSIHTTLDNAGVPVTGTFFQATQPVSAASLPLPSGAATAAKQPALGTAGTAAADVLTVQGIASMTPLKTDGSATTQPVSAASLPLPAGAAQDLTLTAGSAKAITRGGAKGATAAADVTSSAEGTDHQALDVQLWLAGSALDPRARTWALSSSTDSVDISDRAARLLGVVYGSQGTQLKQTATNNNLAAELAVGGTLIDPRAIRALTSADVVSAAQSGTWTVGLGAGSSTIGAVTGPGAAALALDSSVTGLEVAQGSTTSGQKGVLAQCAVTASAPTYVDGQTAPCSLDTAGNLRTSGTGGGTGGGSSFSNDGSAAQLARVKDTDSGAGTHYTAEVILQKSASGGPVDFGTSTDPLRTDPTGTTTQPVSAASLPLPAGAATSAKQAAPGTAGTPSADVLTVQGATSMTPLKTDGSATTQPVSGSVTANIGTTNGVALDATLTGGSARSKITDGTNNAAVKATSTAAVATDPALVVSLSPNSPVPAGTNTIGAVKVTDGTNTAAVKAASTSAAATDPSAVVALSPNPSTVCTSTKAISQSASTDLVTSTNKLHICSIVLVSTTAQSFSLVEGTGTTCATGVVALVGATTAANGIPAAANGGFSAVADRAWLRTATTADHLCLIQSSTGLIAGVITYSDAP